MELYRIILADDHPIVRQGIKKLLGERPDLEVVGEAADGQEVLELLNQTQPDLTLLDIEMPRLGGLKAADEIKKRYPQVKVLILTMHTDDSFHSVAQEIGVEGFVLKDDIDQVLLSAIDALRNGETFTSPLLQSQDGDVNVRKS